MAPERLSRPEFVALMAMLFATVAFSVDAMLPALTDIARDLSPDAANRAQLIVTSFVLGMGIGTLFTGPLSDAVGRKPVIIGGAVLYSVACVIAWASQSLELMLAARVLQGLGASGPRVVGLAIIRDLYQGRQMAQMMSFVMLIFALVPALAPAVGAGIIALTGWRSIFAAFIVFSVASGLWLFLRQAETLPPERRRPFRVPVLVAGIGEVLGHGQVVRAIAILTLTFAILFGTLSSIQPVFAETFERAESFHYWFALIALIAAFGNILNAKVVIHIGMRRVARGAFLMQIVASGLMLTWGATMGWDGPLAFAVFIAWGTGVFTMVGLTIGNLNALAMVPLGHLAGMGASIIGAISTVASLSIAIPLGLLFDGTPSPLALGALVCSVGALALTQTLEEPVADPIDAR